jgi:type II secretory pathway component PulK
MTDPKIHIQKNRENEKGAAMVMALMMSFLLLVGSAGLLLESALNTQNVTDATAEQQAYNAAESGIQSAINVLRGNTVPNPLLTLSKLSSLQLLTRPAIPRHTAVYLDGSHTMEAAMTV